MEEGKERKRNDTIRKIGITERLMYKGKEWKEYKRGGVREHSMWEKGSK